MAITRNIPAQNSALASQPIRDNFNAIADALESGGGGGGGVNIGQGGTASLELAGTPLLQIRNTTGAAQGTFPSVSTQLGFLRVEGVSGTNTFGHGFEIQIRTSNTVPWSGSSRGTEVQFLTGRRNSANPATAFSIGDQGGFFMGGATGLDRGPGTINAVEYFISGQSLETWLKEWILETFDVTERP